MIDVSGHTVGHIAYVFGTENWAFTGDSLMMMGCGRVFEGTFEMMYQSLARFRNMSDEMLICSGHEYAESNARFALSIEPDNPDLLERVAWIRRTLTAGSPTVPSPLGIERLTNPFLRCEVPSVRSALGMESASGAEVFAELRKRKEQLLIARLWLIANACRMHAVILLKRTLLLFYGPFAFLFVALAPVFCSRKKGFRGWYWRVARRLNKVLLDALSIRVENRR